MIICGGSSCLTKCFYLEILLLHPPWYWHRTCCTNGGFLASACAWSCTSNPQGTFIHHVTGNESSTQASCLCLCSEFRSARGLYRQSLYLGWPGVEHWESFRWNAGRLFTQRKESHRYRLTVWIWMYLLILRKQSDRVVLIHLVDFVLKDPREQEDEKVDDTPDYKKEWVQ